MMSIDDMLNINKIDLNSHSLAEINEEIEERELLLKKMVGQLYTSILQDELSKLYAIQEKLIYN